MTAGLHCIIVVMVMLPDFVCAFLLCHRCYGNAIEGGVLWVCGALEVLVNVVCARLLRPR